MMVLQLTTMADFQVGTGVRFTGVEVEEEVSGVLEAGVAGALMMRMMDSGMVDGVTELTIVGPGTPEVAMMTG